MLCWVSNQKAFKLEDLEFCISPPSFSLSYRKTLYFFKQFVIFRGMNVFFIYFFIGIKYDQIFFKITGQIQFINSGCQQNSFIFSFVQQLRNRQRLELIPDKCMPRTPFVAYMEPSIIIWRFTNSFSKSEVAMYHLKFSFHFEQATVKHDFLSGIAMVIDLSWVSSAG